MAALPSTALPTTGQKLIAEALGTAFLVYVGAGSAAATGVISAGSKVPFSMAQLGVISFAFMLVFVIFGVIDHRAVPGWVPMAIGSVVFAIIILGPATGAAINPARYLGTVFLQDASGGTVSWGQVPAYLIGEIIGGLLGGLAYVGVARVRPDAALTHLSPDLPGEDSSPEPTVSGATS